MKSVSIGKCNNQIGLFIVIFCTLFFAQSAGAAGTIVAYAHVNGNGTLDTANSKNVVKMEGANGLYCFMLKSSPKNVVATIAQDASAPNQGPGFIRAALPPTPFFTCANIPKPTSVVATFNQTQSAGGYAFYVLWSK